MIGGAAVPCKEFALKFALGGLGSVILPQLFVVYVSYVHVSFGLCVGGVL